MKEIASIIKENRIKNDLSQEDLGKKLFVTKQAISNWDRGKTLADINTIKNLSDIFHISVDDILYEKRETSYYFKLIWILLIISILIGFVSLFLSRYKNTVQIFILPAYVIMIFILSSSIKNNSYGIIAGYDKNINYDKKTLKLVLCNIAFRSALSLLIYQLLNLALILAKGPIAVYKLLLYVVMTTLFINIIAINIKYQKELIADKVERKKYKGNLNQQIYF